MKKIQIAFQEKPPKPDKTQRTITVQLRDTESPRFVFEIEAKGRHYRFEDEFEDIKAELRQKFDDALERLFGESI